MTVQSTVARAYYAGDGASTIFSFHNYILEDSDIGVVLVDSLGRETPLLLSADYTVQGSGNEAGCSVTLNVPPPIGSTLTLFRTPTLRQDLDLQNGDSFPAEEVEKRLDKAMMIEQRLSDRLDRAMVLPDGDPVLLMTLPPQVSRAGQFLGFDASGLPVAAAAITGGAAATSYMQTLLLAVSATLARNILGFTAGGGGSIPASLIPSGTITGAMLVDAINKTGVSATKIATYSILTSDGLVQLDPTTPFTATLPTAIGVSGKEYEIVHVGAGICTGTIGTTSSQTLKERGATTTSTTLDTPGESIRVKSDGANWVIMSRHIPSVAVSYVPGLTGFGTPTGLTASWQRIGNSLRILIQGTSGTTTATEARANLPGVMTGLMGAIGVVGTWASVTAGAVSGTILQENAKAYVTFGLQAAGNAGLTKVNASTMLSSSTAFSLSALVPITGWNG